MLAGGLGAHRVAGGGDGGGAAAVDHDMRAGPSQSDGDGLTDALGGAGDERGAAGQIDLHEGVPFVAAGSVAGIRIGAGAQILIEKASVVVQWPRWRRRVWSATRTARSAGDGVSSTWLTGIVVQPLQVHDGKVGVDSKVELRGIEPLTFSMRTRRATNCAIAPWRVSEPTEENFSRCGREIPNRLVEAYSNTVAVRFGVG